MVKETKMIAFWGTTMSVTLQFLSDMIRDIKKWGSHDLTIRLLGELVTLSCKRPRLDRLVSAGLAAAVLAGSAEVTEYMRKKVGLHPTTGVADCKR